MPSSLRRLDLRAHLLRAVVDAEREVLEPRHDPRAGARARRAGSPSASAATISYGCAFGSATPYSPGAPVRRVDHRRDVVDVARAIAGMSCATSSGRVAATPKTRRAEEHAVRLERAARLARGTSTIDCSRRPLQAREHHRRDRAVRPAHVVVEDLVDAGLRRRARDVDVVAAHRRVREVREAAVARSTARRRASGSPARSPAFHAAAARIGSRKQTMPADHADALAVERARPQRSGRRSVCTAPICLRERDRRVEADDARLVLQVELDRVDPVLSISCRTPRAASVLPGVEGHVDGADRRGGAAGRSDGDRTDSRVPELVGDGDLDRLLRRPGQRQREVLALDVGPAAVNRHRAARGHRAGRRSSAARPAPCCLRVEHDRRRPCAR